MVTPVNVEKLEVKSHGTPDELRTPNKTRVEVVKLHGYTIGRFNFEPGWRWSECIKPVVKTEYCQLSHVGHVVSGTLTVQMQDGAQTTLSAGESYAIPPGHDAWVEGGEPFVGLEVLSADVYAKSSR
ncbi:cupin domain-containing protein [Comamonas testosteroni]|uniref:cupin domain-containing protein n=1 Tax=Comamonas testosteroni TaxID=285 RepID=UPI002DB9F46E|nr:cupin domain-containing protein [Comamonas testosteroni]MEB5964543.1 cupin domain-containing protein [Comamonas testosteroni]